jgi:hypothetical protein
MPPQRVLREARARFVSHATRFHPQRPALASARNRRRSLRWPSARPPGPRSEAQLRSPRRRLSEALALRRQAASAPQRLRRLRCGSVASVAPRRRLQPLRKARKALTLSPLFSEHSPLRPPRRRPPSPASACRPAAAAPAASAQQQPLRLRSLLAKRQVALRRRGRPPSRPRSSTPAPRPSSRAAAAGACRAQAARARCTTQAGLTHQRPQRALLRWPQRPPSPA